MTLLGIPSVSAFRYAFAALAFVFCSMAMALEVGDTAPDFELPASDGNTYRLSDYRGKQAVILAWFPRAFTSGCTIECKSLTKNGPELRRFDVTYFMASVDPLDENRRFAESNDADFPLLSDASKEVAAAYGVLYQDRFALRHTVYIDTEGVVVAIDSNVDPRTSAEDMIAMLKELDVPLR
ncbi:MAG: peroxiredoxin [Pseudomonadota bacterium]